MKYFKYLLYFVIVISIIFIGSGLLNPSITYENEISINKPAQETWGVFTDETKMSEWLPGYLKMEHVSGNPGTPGAVSKIYFEEDGEEMVMEETINTVKNFEYLSMTFTSDFMDMDYELFLTEKEGGSHILSKSGVRGNGIFAKSMFSFMTKTFEKQEDENLTNLKKVVERNTNIY